MSDTSGLLIIKNLGFGDFIFTDVFSTDSVISDDFSVISVTLINLATRSGTFILS